MPEYIMLFRFTQQGVENIKDSPKRIKSAKQMFESAGAKVKSCYAVLGRFDTVFIAEAPNDETIAKLSLQIASLGNVHTETLRAFSETEFVEIVNKIQ